MEPRTCTTCQHFYVCPGTPDYSELTPGEPMELKCGKYHWDISESEITSEMVREKFLTAIDCPDYQEVPQPVKGELTVPNRPGLGLEFDREAFKHYGA